MKKFMYKVMNKVEWFWYDYKFVFSMLFWFGLVIALAVFAVIQTEKIHCRNIQELYGNTHSVEFKGYPTGCMLQLPSGLWVDVDNIQSIDLGE